MYVDHSLLMLVGVRSDDIQLSKYDIQLVQKVIDKIGLTAV
jgi:hypothetical protein